MKKDSKRKTKILEGLDIEKQYTISEAIKILKKIASAKFDETIEISINLGIDAQQSDQAVRGVIDLPKGTGKTSKVSDKEADAYYKSQIKYWNTMYKEFCDNYKI